MKKTLALILLFTLLTPLAWTMAPHASRAEPGDGTTSVLMIVSLDKKLPKAGKTNGMGYYLMTLNPAKNELLFTSFPYNLAVEMPGKKGPVSKQLQFACKELGPQGAVDVLMKAFGISIDHWLLINMNALAELVDLAGGVEVNLENLSINKKAGDLRYMVSKPMEKIKEPGQQLLNGVQMMAYISDTYYDRPTILVEEARFRERHEVLIRGIVAGLRGAGMDTPGLIAAVFTGFGKHYMTGLDLQTLADIPLNRLTGCLVNEPRFLHVPAVIASTKTDNGWESIGYTQEDVQAVQAFIAP